MKEVVMKLAPEYSKRKVTAGLEVSRSHVESHASLRSVQDAALRRDIERVHAASGKAYGAPRVHEELKEQGEQVSRKRVARIMREAGICGQQPRKFVPTTDSKHEQPVAENLLERNFSPAVKDTVWVGDITYLRTGRVWSYLSVLIDLYSRRVVGWHLCSSLATEGPRIALKQAAAARLPEHGLLVHHDRGCQYASELYRAQLETIGATLSMSRKGNCWDNAVAESFFATLKRELGETFISFDVAQAALTRYFNWYNCQRRHSHNHGLSPIKKELAICMRMVA
jgi:putative transposase